MPSRARTCVIVVLLAAAAPLVGCQSSTTSTRPAASSALPASALPPAAQVGLPVAATVAVVPGDNPQTAEKVALGRRLFFERRLSADGTVACASCHDPGRAFTDGRPASVGIKGRLGERNAQTILNALYRAVSLEDQAVMPILNPSEMGQPDLATAVAAIARDRRYRREFQAVFGRAPNGPDLTRALAAWERTQAAFGAPFDAFVAGNAAAIGEPAKRGWALFLGKARCNQ